MPYAPKTHAALQRERVGRPRDTRLNAAQRGYGAQWRKYRAWYLMRHPLCMRCEKKGILRPAVHVHHIVSLRDGGAQYDEANCEALCQQCHNKQTAIDRERLKGNR